jgi:hypothetical protein
MGSIGPNQKSFECLNLEQISKQMFVLAILHVDILKVYF